MADTPTPDVDFVVTFDGSNIPSVVLTIGEDQQGTMYEWRVWCTDGGGSPADIGSITAPGAYNYSVKVLNPSNQAGARNLGSAVLAPSGNHHSSLAAGSLLSGDLSGDLTVQTFAGSGGVLNLAVNGSVSASSVITAQTIGQVTLGNASSDVMAGQIVLANNIGAGQLLRIWTLTGDVDLGGGTLAGDLELHNDTTGAILNGGAIDGSGFVALSDTFGPFAGTATFTSVADGGLIRLQGGDLEGTLEITADMNGEILLNAARVDGSGMLLVDGNLGGQIRQTSLGISGKIQIGGDADGPADSPSIEVATLFAATPTGGRIIIGGSVANHNATGAEIVVDSILQNASVRVDGVLLGQIHATSDVDNGKIAIGGDVDGPTDAPAIKVDGDLVNAARITVDGSLLDHNASGAEIVVGGTMDALAAIAIDYDGWHDGDDWASGATIDIVGDGTAAYTGNTPAVRIWEILTCIANCNNDDANMGKPDSFDIAAFAAALTGQATYAAAYPGLEGSRIYHADCNCDGEVDSFDIAAFIDRLTTQECDIECSGGDGGLLGGEPAMAAEDVAALFTKNLTDEQLAAFMESLADLVNRLGDSAEAEFWAEVLELLGG